MNTINTINTTQHQLWLPKTWLGPLALTASLFLGSCANHHYSESEATAATDPINVDEWVDAAKNPVAAEEPPVEPPALWESLRYTLDLHQVPLTDVLRQLAADAGLELFMGGRVRGGVHLHVREQLLTDILADIERRSRYFIAIEGNTLVVLPNDSEMRTYLVGYPNMQRQTRSQIQTSLQLAVNGGGGEGGGQSNQSVTEVINTSENVFWTTLVQTIESILGDSAPAGAAPAGKGAQGSRVIAHPESGRVLVYANRRQHRLLAREIDALMRNMYRQVLIEATVLELELSNSQRNGIDWQAILNGKWRIWQQGSAGDFTPTFGVRYTNNTSNGVTNAMIELLESFGHVRVVSQPKLMALNNQSAVLKVVDERVYFTTQVENILNENTSNISYETTIHSVPVGFTMSITPWINESHDVILNLKPSLTRIVRMVNDPNPALAEARVTSQVPELQIREMETIMRIRNGQVGVIGGLIQETNTRDRSGIPKLHSSPGVGWLFGKRSKELRRSELIILLRPLVDAS